MGRPRDPVNNTEFPKIWRQIRSYHSEKYRSRLRIAANLIGFHLFPIGWNWTEYDAVTDRDQCPYEASAIAAGQEFYQGLLGEATSQKLIKNSRRFRTHKVERLLRELLDRRIIQVFEGSLAEPRALTEFSTIEKPLDDKDRLIFRVAASEIGARMYSRKVCEIDANQLVDYLIKGVEPRGREGDYDWRSVEAWLRRSIESEGLSQNKAERVLALQEWYSLIDPEEVIEPPTDRCKLILNALCDEYGYTKKTEFIRL